MAVVGCSPKEETSTEGNEAAPTTEAPSKPEIVATSTMVADMVRTIAGDDFAITALMAPGIDPHSYELPAQAYSALRHADAIIYNGLHLEGKLTETFEKLGGKALALTDHLPADQLIPAEEIDEEYGDPHVWGDAALWAQAVPAVVGKLSALLPEQTKAFEERGAAYQAELIELDKWAKQRVAEIPEGHRTLITSHDAFNYFGNAYGIEVIAPQGISTEDEPSGAAILATIDLIKERGVKAVFPESSVDTAIIERISTDAGVKKGETLFSDSCGPAEEPTGTYIGMMRHNVNAIVDALK